jgi:hypothetical protein
VVQDITPEETTEEEEDTQTEEEGPWWKNTLIGRLAGPENSRNGYR